MSTKKRRSVLVEVMFFSAVAGALIFDQGGVWEVVGAGVSIVCTVVLLWCHIEARRERTLNRIH